MDEIGRAPVFSVSDAVAVLNQTLQYTYSSMVIIGELANFKIAKDKWVYADIKDDTAKIRCFGTIYQLPGPLEDGMMLEITAEPRIHPQFGFSLNILSMRPVGEGSIKKAANLLQAKLEKEGLFAPERKRSIPYAPASIGLIASEQSAGYADFIKIMQTRWQGVAVELFDAQVQGESAPESLIAGLNHFNQQSQQVEVLVMIRGGGSADDLAAFSVEQVVRTVATSRIPTLVAVGHEIDVSLAELAADLRASTPSNAAELLFPNRTDVMKQLSLQKNSLDDALISRVQTKQARIETIKLSLEHAIEKTIDSRTIALQNASTLLDNIHPKATLRRGYAIVQKNSKLISSVTSIKKGDTLDIILKNGTAKVTAEGVQ